MENKETGSTKSKSFEALFAYTYGSLGLNKSAIKVHKIWTFERVVRHSKGLGRRGLGKLGL